MMNPYAPGREPGGFLRWREGTTTTTTTVRHAVISLVNYAAERVAEAHGLRAHVNRLIGREVSR